MDASQIEPDFDTGTDRYKVIKVWPHDKTAFTEGLVYRDGALYESAGGDEHTPSIGTSSIRRTFLNKGGYSLKVPIDKQFFAEGLTILGEQVFQVTFRNQVGFVYDLSDLKKTGGFTYEGEGWGLTHDESLLILSDGTDRLRFLDPVKFMVQRTLPLTEGGCPRNGLNELEYANNRIYGNVLNEDRLVVIDPGSGAVIDSVDLNRLARRFKNVGELNGIAYDSSLNRWFVTGKNWPNLFELRFSGHYFPN